MKTQYEQEVLDRIVRIESRMVQLGDYVGANLRTKQKIRVYATAQGTAVEIDSLDVSISRIMSELGTGEYRGSVPVFCRNRRVMELFMA